MKKITQQIVFGVILGFSTQIAFSADYELTVQSSDPEKDQNFKIQQEWADKLYSDSNNRLKINLVPVGSVVKYNETLDAISTGVLDGHLTATGYFSDKDPAFGLLGNMVGAWSNTDLLLEYMNEGGGNQIMTDLYLPYGVRFVGASTTGVESFVSRIPLDGVDDLRGIKLRTPGGLVQQVFAAAGAIAYNWPGSKVKPGLESGEIDAADYTVFSTNHQAGLNDIAPHPVQPGFHSLPLIDMSIKETKWQELPPDLQTLLKQSVKELAKDITSKLKAADDIAVMEAKANPNITIHDWSATERKKFYAIARAQWQVFSMHAPNAERAYRSVTKFLKKKGLLK